MRQGFLVKVLLLVLALTIQVALPDLASAHAELRSADPAPGAELARPPKEIRLTFTEPLEEGSTFSLMTTDFQEISGISAMIDTQHREQLYAQVPELSPGVYTVQWMALTSDGARTTGSYRFGVREPGIPGRAEGLIIMGIVVLTLFFGSRLWLKRRA